MTMRFRLTLLALAVVLASGTTGIGQFSDAEFSEINSRQFPEKQIAKSWAKMKRQYVADVRSHQSPLLAMELAPETSNYLDTIAMGPSEEIILITVRVEADGIHVPSKKIAPRGVKHLSGRPMLEYQLHPGSELGDAAIASLSGECIMFYRPGGLYFGGMSGEGHRVGSVTIVTSKRVVEIAMTPLGFNLLLNNGLAGEYFSFGNPALAAVVWELCHKDIGDEDARLLQDTLSGMERLRKLATRKTD